jgi:hypothetical protein
MTTHLQLVPRSRIRGSIHSLLHTSLWHNASLVKHKDNLTFCFYRNKMQIAVDAAINDSGSYASDIVIVL